MESKGYYLGVLGFGDSSLFPTASSDTVDDANATRTSFSGLFVAFRELKR